MWLPFPSWGHSLTAALFLVVSFEDTVFKAIYNVDLFVNFSKKPFYSCMKFEFNWPSDLRDV